FLEHNPTMLKKFSRTGAKRIIGRRGAERVLGRGRGRIACCESLEHRVLFHDGEFHAVANTLPTLTITRQATNASENGAIRSFNITRSGSLAAALPVSFLIGGRAKNGVD